MSSDIPAELFARFSDLGRESSTLTVMFHTRIAEQMGLSGTDHKCLDLAMRAEEPITAGRLAELFPDGGTIGVDELVEAGAVRKGAPVKVLGTGELDGVTLNITAHRFSGSAKEKITAAGGSVTELS